MDENLKKYKNMKIKFNNEVDNIRICYKGIEDNFKIIKVAENITDVPYKNEIYISHTKFIKNLLKKCKELCQNNDNQANQMNNYDIAFTSSKIAIENNLREIIDGNDENNNNDLVENIKTILKPNLDEAFKKLNNENSIDYHDKDDNYNDMKNIFEKNIKLNNDFVTYMNKVKLFEKKK